MNQKKKKKKTLPTQGHKMWRRKILF